MTEEFLCYVPGRLIYGGLSTIQVLTLFDNDDHKYDPSSTECAFLGLTNRSYLKLIRDKKVFPFSLRASVPLVISPIKHRGKCSCFTRRCLYCFRCFIYENTWFP